MNAKIEHFSFIQGNNDAFFDFLQGNIGLKFVFLQGNILYCPKSGTKTEKTCEYTNVMLHIGTTRLYLCRIIIHSK